jgi:hypothetical protein
VRLGLEAADPSRGDSWFEELESKLGHLEAAMAERPFGNLEKAGPTAREIIRWLDQPLKLLDQKVQYKPAIDARIVDQATALTMLHALGKHPDDWMPDYETARQLAWAFQTIYREWSRKPNQPKKEIVDTLHRLDRQLQLTLGPGLAAQRTAILDSIGGRLSAAANYNPREFVTEFQLLLGALPQIHQAPPQKPPGGN